jgi:hypothetical protein
LVLRAVGAVARRSPTTAAASICSLNFAGRSGSGVTLLDGGFTPILILYGACPFVALTIVPANRAGA